MTDDTSARPDGPVDLTPEDLADLTRAKSLLENPGLAAKLADWVGTPIEKGLKLLPDGASKQIERATTMALERASGVALWTLDNDPGTVARPKLHKLLVGATGAAGGIAGLATLAVELPVSTVVMVRAIADIARSEGESKEDPTLGPEIMSVLALGGPTRSDDGTESGYYAARLALAAEVSAAARWIAKHGVAREGGPAITRLIATIATRLQIQITEKAAAQMLPIIGALGGATINMLFIDHFQDMARGHFIVRRLERTYGMEAVRSAYGALPAGGSGSSGP